MRIAILLTGQPRHLEQGAWWFKNRVFPYHFRHINVDYYCCFWDDKSPDLKERIQRAYNPVKYEIHNYKDNIVQFRKEVDEFYEENPGYNLDKLNHQITNNVCLRAGFESSFANNFWGMFLCIDKATQMMGNVSDDYDIIIKTRSDVAMNPMSEKHWIDSFKNIYRNSKVFGDKILSDFLYIKNGLPFIGDFAFFTKPKNWYNYTKDFKANCLKLATVDNMHWYNENWTYDVPFPHKTWVYLSYYTATSWLSWHVVWPTPYGNTLIRDPNTIMEQQNYDSLVKIFWDHADDATKNWHANN